MSFSSESSRRPPDTLFTDSNGRFVVYSLNQGENYTITVETEAPNWALTITSFTPYGRRPTVRVYLNPYSPPHPGAATISAAALRGDIPKAARREFEDGTKEAANGNHAKARKRFEKALGFHPNFMEARNELAVVLMKDGDLAGAEKQLRTALESDPAAAVPLMNLGLCMFRQKRYAEALAPLERAIQLQPENYRAQLLLGVTWVMTGDDPRAEATLLRAYELGGERAAMAQYHLARYYTRKKDYRQAAHALETYLQEVPGDPYAAQLSKTLERLRATFAKN